VQAVICTTQSTMRPVFLAECALCKIPKPTPSCYWLFDYPVIDLRHDVVKARTLFLTHSKTPIVHSHASRCSATTQHLAGLLVALARAGHTAASVVGDSRWASSAWHTVLRRAPHMQPQAVCNCVWALARMRCHPGASKSSLLDYLSLGLICLATTL
jgi:hypothetical protein